MRHRITVGCPQGRVVLVLACVFLAVCSTADEIPEGPVEIGISGRWHVTSHECPAGCPSTTTQDEWADAVVEFSDTLVVFGRTECRAPTYRAAVELATYSASESALGGGRLVQIDCYGRRWESPGAVLVVESSEVARAIWQGSVLQLRRPAG